MRVITKKRLEEFWARHATAKAPLAAWHRVITKSRFADFNQLRCAFGSVDYVAGFYVFNAGPFRLIAAIHFNRQMVFVRHVLTHDDYDRGKWRAR